MEAGQHFECNADYKYKLYHVAHLCSMHLMYIYILLHIVTYIYCGYIPTIHSIETSDE